LVTGELTWSERTKALWGLLPDATVTFADLVGGRHPDDRERIAAAVQRALDPAGPGAFDEEFRVIAADSSVRWVQVRGRAIFETHANQLRAVRFVGTALDVTARRLAEEALRRAVERERARARELSAI